MEHEHSAALEMLVAAREGRDLIVGREVCAKVLKAQMIVR
jgi:hypothetical protein